MEPTSVADRGAVLEKGTVKNGTIELCTAAVEIAAMSEVVSQNSVPAGIV